MKIQVRLFRDASSDAAGGLGSLLNPVSLGLGALQTGFGIIEGIKTKKKINGLLAQQKAYQTPQEIYDILHATQNRASQGYDATTLDYLNSQTDQAFSSAVGAGTRMGADPNDLSSLFQLKINSIMKIGADNHQANTQNFSQYLSALGSVAENKAAEQKSQQDILKNKLQAAGVNLNNATGNISGGLNTILSTLSADKMAKLYTSNNKPLPELVTT